MKNRTTIFRHTHLRFLTTLVVAVMLVAWSPSSDADELTNFQNAVRSVFKTYCGQCHGDGNDVEGELNLLQLSPQDLAEDAELIRKLIDVVDQNEMPPADQPQPTDEERQRLLAELKSMMNAAVLHSKTDAHAPIRRMNRFQYNNAVVDLFDLNCIVFTLPERMMRGHKGYFKPETQRMADVVHVGSRPLGKSQMIEPRLAGVAAFPQDLRAEHGFDNQADHLSLSPLLMESFLKLGQSITQSPDFVPRRVGIWESFFEPPAEDRDVETAVRQRLQPFLQNAFRIPVEPDVLNRYVAFVMRQLANDVPFTDAMKSVAAATIASPKFLYLYDASTHSETSAAINDLELASRLSFFLWGSLPDQTLLQLASAGQLHNPEVLHAQVDRMLKDHKIKRFCDSFPAQWLQLERIISSVPNPDKYSDFYFSKYRDSMHMMIEPLLLFETVLIENLPVTQLIDSDFSYRSVLLDNAYGDLSSKAKHGHGNGGEVAVLTFRRVPISDRRMGGIITNAAVMTMTSGPDRTQPITRGAWLAAVIFNDPPEPPPADVPALEEKPPAGEEQMTLKERLSQHRERADCRGCHEQIDPLGFALENFDPIGMWRDKYENGRDVDMAGTLFQQHQFANVAEFKDSILAEKDRFVRALAGHLLSFALARELKASDQAALDKMTQATLNDDCRMKTLLHQIVQSTPFLSKTSPTAPR